MNPPKKQTNERICSVFSFLISTAKKTSSFVCFFGRFYGPQIYLWFYLTFTMSDNFKINSQNLSEIDTMKTAIIQKIFQPILIICRVQKSSREWIWIDIPRGNHQCLAWCVLMKRDGQWPFLLVRQKWVQNCQIECW